MECRSIVASVSLAWPCPDASFGTPQRFNSILLSVPCFINVLPPLYAIVFEIRIGHTLFPFPSSSLLHLTLSPNLDQWSPSPKDRVHSWDRDSSGVRSFLPRFLLVGFAEIVVRVWTALLDVTKGKIKKGRRKGGRYLWIQAHVFIIGAAL
jgi:hypothetical protein